MNIFLVTLFAGLASGVLIPLLFCTWKLVNKHLSWKDKLYPYYSPEEAQKYTRYYIRTRYQDTDPLEKKENAGKQLHVPSRQLIPLFLSRSFKKENSDDRFYIVLADWGMGKTAFMINLFKKLYTKAFPKKFDVTFISLNYPGFEKEIANIDDSKKVDTILLLDAFDESPEAEGDYINRLKEITKMTHRFRKIIITCRRQLFSSDQELGETGILRAGGGGAYKYKKVYISPFDQKDVEKFLNKKFPIFNFNKRQMKEKAKEIVGKYDVLMERPIFLNYVDIIIKNPENYHYAFQVYETLINELFKREAQKNKHEAEEEHFKKELARFTRAVAVDIYEKREARKGLFIEEKNFITLARQLNIQLKDIDLKCRTLMSRFSHEYKFAHKSILEYFLALEMYENTQFRKGFTPEGMEQAKSFYDERWRQYVINFVTQKNAKGHPKYQGVCGLAGQKLKILSDIVPEDVDNIMHLRIESTGLADINFLQKLEELKELYLGDNRLKDIQVLENLKKLQKLDLSMNQLNDVSALKKLVRLEELDLSQNQLSSIMVLENCKQLLELNLSCTQLTDVCVLCKLKELWKLDVNGNKLIDITPLEKLEKLRELNLSNNQVCDISFLKELRNLERLDLRHNNIRDIGPLRELTQLEQLYLSNNQISDIKALKGLKNLKELDLSSNQLSDITALAALVGLGELHLESNQISDPRPLIQLINLWNLNIKNNGVTSEQFYDLKQSLPNLKYKLYY